MMRRLERRRHATMWGVDEAQIDRDHIISHVLHRWEDSPMANGAFFGGTALSRRVLSGFRLSEDIDVIIDDAPQVARQLQEWLPRASRPEYRISVELQKGSATEQAIVSVDQVPYPLKIELVPADHGWERFPTSSVPTELRYNGLPTHTNLVVPTSDAFAAMKLAAWSDRRTPRDLADLYALSRMGAITSAAVELALVRGFPVIRGHWSDRQPTALREQDWESALINQLAEVLPSVVAWRVTRAALAKALDWDDDEVRWEADAVEAVADVEVKMDTSIDLFGSQDIWPPSLRGTPYCGTDTVLGIPCTNPATPGGAAAHCTSGEDWGGVATAKACQCSLAALALGELL